MEQFRTNNPALIAQRLKKSGMRPTRQRIMLCQMLWADPQPRHVTAENLYAQTKKNNSNISLATVYNTLHQLTEMNLLSKVTLESGKTHFDTNTEPHQHIINDVTGEIMDMPEEFCIIPQLKLPEGMALSALEIVVRVRPETQG